MRRHLTGEIFGCCKNKHFQFRCFSLQSLDHGTLIHLVVSPFVRAFASISESRTRSIDLWRPTSLALADEFGDRRSQMDSRSVLFVDFPLANDSPPPSILSFHCAIVLRPFRAPVGKVKWTNFVFISNELWLDK